jgi:hypothetical protein
MPRLARRTAIAPVSAPDIQRTPNGGHACVSQEVSGRAHGRIDFTYDRPGFGKIGTGVLKMDNKEVAARKIPHTVPFLFALDETFDVGVDTRTGVDDNDYRVPFRFLFP